MVDSSFSGTSYLPPFLLGSPSAKITHVSSSMAEQTDNCNWPPKKYFHTHSSRVNAAENLAGILKLYITRCIMMWLNLDIINIIAKPHPSVKSRRVCLIQIVATSVWTMSGARRNVGNGGNSGNLKLWLHISLTSLKCGPQVSRPLIKYALI